MILHYIYIIVFLQPWVVRRFIANQKDN
uniref:Uncharacterized protein n=1 Tax=Anguilla anguilla TaxID=7936 RepID=A0A0E9QK63_ANGAN